MKRLTAVALLAIAVGAIMHFWPSGDQPPIAPPASQRRVRPRFACRAFAQSDARAGADDDARAITRAGGPVGHRRAAPGYAGAIRDSRPGHGAVGGHFSCDDRGASPAGNPAARVLGDVQAVDTAARRIVARRVRAARRHAPAQFEEVSDGSLLVRMDLESGVIAGAGSIAVVEFQALRRGVSPLAVEGVTYVEDGRQDATNMPTAYEGSITVE